MSEPNVLETLKAARKIIEIPEHWTKGAHARDSRGEGVPMRTPEAICWCAQGAITITCPAAGSELWSATHKALSRVLPTQYLSTGNAVTHFNDDPKTTHAEVLAAFDEAIAKEAQ